MEMDELEESASTDNEDVFYFESEHLALRGNQCYSDLLRTIAILQAQRIRVHQQIDEVEQARNFYLGNPQVLIDKIRNNEPLIGPNYITTINLPELPTLSQKMAAGTDGNASSNAANTFMERKPAPQSPTQPHLQDNDSNRRSDSFNRLWTNEEQRRLEALLIEYPPEEIEMRRFAKIAKALGDRTPQQVFSRVQKYFQKLHDAGMPVPGRIPKHRRPGLSKPKNSIRRSTFFPAHNISMQMPEDDFVLDDLQPVAPPPPPVKIKTEVKAEPTVDDEKEDRRRRQLTVDILTTIYDEKIANPEGYNPDPLAPRCAACEESSVTSKRWRCNSCYCYINLCGDCLADQLMNERFEHIGHDVVMDEET
ncbi:ZZ-type zinc finger-containing protein 3 [Scaptodrosophila lebanonensis]|uniref:ZZ-type zinc finger-containing protein 3 n=1 Tax=Drosophila lebanonensis TaxID=7225 RepID=A0A6J2UFE5_DROLE|nr:ZZ-type zinc finger-containing protein 3 [Scaptodrosophila lebanonensis]